MKENTSYKSHKWLNFLHSALILIAMGLILCLLGWLIAGVPGIFWSLLIGLTVIVITSRMSPLTALKAHNAYALHPSRAPRIYQIVKELSRSAGLSFTPTLYFIPSPSINAYSVGHKHNAVIALTAGMLRSLNNREIIGVLAHEISHIRNNDIWIMNLADAASRVTNLLALTGQFLLLLNLPLILMEEHHISWWIIGLLIFAPSLSALMQLALARTREFDADIDAAMLTNDPLGLAQALAKLEYSTGSWLEKIFWPGKRSEIPSVLRTHPKTEDRIQRLVSLAQDINGRPYMTWEHQHPYLPEDINFTRDKLWQRLLRKWL